ncbi:unnamed protein product [Psylliodes chrysocephalus]|uniref:Uncharacterized protein n=1 Tax=Psylliodes chrysocephalus TaxID=3402493 RepID=A0A9P0CUB3_9CUCU|nr:unnamed protein product [Psylliodes chrysocephala]
MSALGVAGVMKAKVKLGLGLKPKNYKMSIKNCNKELNKVKKVLEKVTDGINYCITILQGNPITTNSETSNKKRLQHKASVKKQQDSKVRARKIKQQEKMDIDIADDYPMTKISIPLEIKESEHLNPKRQKPIKRKLSDSIMDNDDDDDGLSLKKPKIDLNEPIKITNNKKRKFEESSINEENEEEADYQIGLIDFFTYNTIPNVDKTNNMFYIDKHEISIPEGSYEVDDIARYIHFKLKEIEYHKESSSSGDKTNKTNKSNVLKKSEEGKPELVKSNIIKPPEHQQRIKRDISNKQEGEEEGEYETVLLLKTNHNTLKCEIKSNKTIHFEKPKSIASLLGFEKKKLSAFQTHESKYPININKVNSICIDCNIVRNSYNNNKSVHTVHMFFPRVPPGYKIIQVPTNVIYLPINTKYIDEIVIKIVDQDGNLINFKQEVVTVRLHLRKV